MSDAHASPIGNTARSGAGAAHPPDTAAPIPASLLLQRCAQGDRDAFMILHDAMAPRVFGIIRTVLGPGSRADDAFQDAMWEIWRRAASYSPALGSAEAWMLMIARSRAIDLLRRDRRASDLKAQLARQARDREATPVSSAPGRREGLDACDRALEELAPEHASVIRLAYLKGLSREQIAEALEIPVGTVKTRIRTGIRTMIEALAAGQTAGGESRA